MSIPGNDGPYRDKVDEIMAEKAKTEDHRARTNGARIFDSLVLSNIELVKAMKAAMKAGTVFLLIFATIATVMMTTAIIMLRQGQADTRALISAIQSQQKNCTNSSTTRKD